MTGVCKCGKWAKKRLLIAAGSLVDEKWKHEFQEEIYLCPACAKNFAGVLKTFLALGGSEADASPAP